MDYSSGKANPGKPSTKSKSPEELLNDKKYELMLVNQSLGIVNPDSDLGKNLKAQREVLQKEIDRMEAELARPPVPKEASQPKKFKKLVQDDGKVRIWSSSS